MNNFKLASENELVPGETKDIANEISDIMVPNVARLIEVADRYGMERNIVVKAAAKTFSAIALIMDFTNFKEE